VKTKRLDRANLFTMKKKAPPCATCGQTLDSVKLRKDAIRSVALEINGMTLFRAYKGEIGWKLAEGLIDAYNKHPSDFEDAISSHHEPPQPQPTPRAKKDS